MRHALVRMARLARAAGATELVAVGSPARLVSTWRASGSDDASHAFERYEERLAGFDFAPNRGGVFSAHQMGSVRMGADPRDASVRSIGPGARRTRRRRTGRRALRRRRLALPDRHRRQPDGHDHGHGPAGRASDPGRDLIRDLWLAVTGMARWARWNRTRRNDVASPDREPTTGQVDPSRSSRCSRPRRLPPSWSGCRRA